MMKLGLFLGGPGQHIAAWRDPATEPDAGQRLRHFVNLAQRSEQALFDFAFVADTNANFGPDTMEFWKRTSVAHRIEPMTLLGALSAVTERIGLVATATTTYLDPFHVARAFASLDQLSEGRIGWNLVTSSAAAEALNFGHAAHVPHDERYDRATEFAQVVLGLWDTFDDDAFVMDKADGLFFKTAKLHLLNHKGRHFSVRGPLMMRRSPQGRPVIVHAGQSEAGRTLAARVAEVVFSIETDIGKGKEFYTDLKRRAAGFGRTPESIKIMPGIMVIVGASKAEAEERHAQLQALIHPDISVANLSNIIGADLSQFPLDGPLPDVPLTNTQQGRQQLLVDMARRENLTIRELARRTTGSRGHRTICGTAADIADSLEEWYTGGAADGFNVLCPTLPEGFEDFMRFVVPEIQRRGLFRKAYEGKTLRENLGLQRPENQFFAGSMAAE